MNGWDRELRAFMCYARANDKGDLTQLRENLSSEVEQYIGEEFHIFKDTEDIKWGEDWEKRIEESLSEVIFFIPIITPSFFRSKYCCGELRRFLDREKKLGRNDLVLPIYYIETPLLEKEAEREITDQDEDFVREIKNLAQIISYRQRPSCADWRKLRSKCRSSFDSEEIYDAIEGLAAQIRDALTRFPIMKTKSKSRDMKQQAFKRDTRTKTCEGSLHPRLKGQSIRDLPRSLSENSILVVSPEKKKTCPSYAASLYYSTISEAIEAADPDAIISVEPGLYLEGLIIDKPLKIIGVGKRDEIKVQAKGKNVILFKTTVGFVSNLTLRQFGGGDWNAVDIAQGRLTLEGCDISSQRLACVSIHDGADPLLRRNVIHDGKQNGVHIYDNGCGKLEDNDIITNASVGVEIHGGANPSIYRNRINRNKLWGIWAHDNGSGIVEGNDLRDNAKGAWSISHDSEPKIKRSGNLE